MKKIKNVKYWRGNWSDKDCVDNPRSIFVFGDNTLGIGKAGQAVIRDNANAFGVVTKKLPSNKDGAFYLDDDFHEFKIHVDRNIKIILDAYNSDEYEEIVLSENGYGNGLARLHDTSPVCFSYLTAVLKHVFGFENPIPK